MSARSASPNANKRSIISEIVCGLRHDLYARYDVTVLKAFIDDSGSGGDSPWYVLAGYVGTIDGWNSFDHQWRAVLDQEPRVSYFKGDRFDDHWRSVLKPEAQISYFKSSEAESLRPDGLWRGISKAQRDSKIDDLIAVIQRCARNAVYIRVKQRDYDAVVKGVVPPKWDNPYFFLFAGIITSAVAVEKLYGDGEPIEFIFDNNERVENPSRTLYGQMKEMPYFTGRIANVLYRDDKQFTPLQAADLLAWQTRRAFCVSHEPSRKHFDSARACIRPHVPHIMTRDDLEKWVEALEERARQYASDLGVSLETVQPWKRKP